MPTECYYFECPLSLTEGCPVPVSPSRRSPSLVWWMCSSGQTERLWNTALSSRGLMRRRNEYSHVPRITHTHTISHILWQTHTALPKKLWQYFDVDYTNKHVFFLFLYVLEKQLFCSFNFTVQLPLRSRGWTIPLKQWYCCRAWLLNCESSKTVQWTFYFAVFTFYEVIFRYYNYIHSQCVKMA